MQDFGDELLYKAVNDTPHLELQLYRLAIDVLNQLHKSPPPEQVGSYFQPEMSKALVTTLPWYCDKRLSQDIQKEAEISLNKLDWSNPVLVLRDFHAQNLIYRYEQSALAQIGVLDFQDAQLGHPLYDVTSLIHDARRILNPSVVSLLLQELTKIYRGQDDLPPHRSSHRFLLCGDARHVPGGEALIEGRGVNEHLAHVFEGGGLNSSTKMCRSSVHDCSTSSTS